MPDKLKVNEWIAVLTYSGNARPTVLWSKPKQPPESPDQRWSPPSQGSFSSLVFYCLTQAGTWGLGPSLCPEGIQTQHALTSRVITKWLFHLMKFYHFKSQPVGWKKKEITSDILNRFCLKNEIMQANFRSFWQNKHRLYKNRIKTPHCVILKSTSFATHFTWAETECSTRTQMSWIVKNGHFVIEQTQVFSSYYCSKLYDILQQ